MTSTPSQLPRLGPTCHPLFPPFSTPTRPSILSLPPSFLRVASPAHRLAAAGQCSGGGRIHLPDDWCAELQGPVRGAPWAGAELLAMKSSKGRRAGRLLRGGLRHLPRGASLPPRARAGRGAPLPPRARAGHGAPLPPRARSHSGSHAPSPAPLYSVTAARPLSPRRCPLRRPATDRGGAGKADPRGKLRWLEIQHCGGGRIRRQRRCSIPQWATP